VPLQERGSTGLPAHICPASKRAAISLEDASRTSVTGPDVGCLDYIGANVGGFAETDDNNDSPSAPRSMSPRDGTAASVHAIQPARQQAV